MEDDLSNEPAQRPGPQPRTPVDVPTVIKRAQTMFLTMQEDREALDLYANYASGKQTAPYTPNYADPTAKKMAERSIMNLIKLAINIPAQISFIDGYSREGDLEPKEWDVWHDSQMPAKQTRLFISSLTYGAGYTMLNNIGTDKRRIDILSARDTVCYFEDPINDTTPIWGLTIKSHPYGDMPGRAIYADDERVVYLDFDGGDFKVAKNGDVPHKLGICPIVRWPAILDDRGYASGVVDGLMTAQDRVNQTVFDLLIDQSYGAYKVRTAAGLVGEPVFKDDGTPLLDAADQQVYKPIQVSQSRMLTTDDPDTKFGTLDETPLEGFILALDSAIKSFAVTAQLPPHSLMGSMSNLSAETLQAMMGMTTRFVSMLKAEWAEAAKTQMTVVSRDLGIEKGIKPRQTEMRWRDMSDYTMAAIVDALGKGAEMLQIPGRALWSRFPGVSDSEIAKWEKIRDEERANGMMEDPDDLDASFNREAAPATPTPADVFGTQTQTSTTTEE